MRAEQAGYGKQLTRYDVDGTLVKTVLIANTDYTNGVSALIYESNGDQLYLLLTDGNYPPKEQFAVLPRPTDDTPLTAAFVDVWSPCAYAWNISGVDAAGNLYLAQSQGSSTSDYRVCAFTPKGELLPAAVQVDQRYRRLQRRFHRARRLSLLAPSRRWPVGDRARHLQGAVKRAVRLVARDNP